MPAEKEKKKHKLIDIAVELQVSLDDIRSFVEELGYRTTNSTKVTDSVKELILDNYSDEKKKSDLHKRLKAEKNRKIQLLEKRVSPQAEKQSKKKKLAKKAGDKANVEGQAHPAPAKQQQKEVPAEHKQPEQETLPEVQAPPEMEQAKAVSPPPTSNDPAALSDVSEIVVEQESVPVHEEAPPAQSEPSQEKETSTVKHEAAVEPTASPEPTSVSEPAEKSPEGENKITEPVVSEPEHSSQDEPASEPTPAAPNEVAESDPEPITNEADKPNEQQAVLSTEENMETEPAVVESTPEPTMAEVNDETPAQVLTEEKVTPENEASGTQEADTDTLQAEISRQQSEISNRFSQSENIAGLKVFGEIELHKKKRKRKKNFREQAKDLKQQIKPDQPKTQEQDKQDEKAKKEKPKARPNQNKKEKETPAAPKKPAKEENQERPAKKKGKKAVDEKVVERNIRQTMMTMDDSTDSSSRQKFRKIRKKERLREQEMEAAAKEAASKVMKITEFASTHELADMLGVTPKEVIQKCFKLGKFITINQRLDKETIELLSLEFNYEVQFISDVEATEIDEDPDNPEDLQTRPPVITIMGHVDHGKTSLLDYIRNSNVVAGESGGITQHMGAYEVTLENKQKLTFLDTPGHEAFTAMRARGAQVTDVVILVVAADDNVMPQTVEAINHSKAAEVPIVVAINKIDKPEANSEKIRTQLADIGVLVEDWGGAIQCQEISAKKGLGVRDLIDKVLVESELLELKANYSEEKLAKGVVIEAELDKGKGVVATVMVQTGIVNVGMPFVAGGSSGRIRAMLDERGKRLETAYPSQPVRILGFEELPQAGDVLSIVPTDREAREIAQRRQIIRREHEFRHSSRVKLNDIAKQVQEGQVQELRVIIKADTDGSIQALADGLMKVQTDEVKVEVIHRGVGQITETDVLLAAASDAIIIGFRVRPNVNAKKLAEKEEIDIRFYSVIYHVLEDIHDALEGMLSPDLQEKVIGSVEIREVFKISKIGNVAGCYVLDGKIHRDNRVRLLRDGIQVFDGVLDSLKRHKDDVKEVETGYECGLTLKNFDDIKVGDVVEAFETVETKRKLVVS